MHSPRLPSLRSASMEVQLGSPPHHPQELQDNTIRDSHSQPETSETETIRSEDSQQPDASHLEGVTMESTQNVLPQHGVAEHISSGSDSSDIVTPPRKRRRCDIGPWRPIRPLPVTHGVGGQAAAPDDEQPNEEPEHRPDNDDEVEAEGDETTERDERET